jgi:hypothetical protein
VSIIDPVTLLENNAGVEEVVQWLGKVVLRKSRSKSFCVLAQETIESYAGEGFDICKSKAINTGEETKHADEEHFLQLGFHDQ